MSLHPAIVLSYPEAAILGAGILASWFSIWMRATANHQMRSPWDLIAIAVAFAIGFAGGWYAHTAYVSGALQ